MARTNRAKVDGDAWYHVMSRTNGRHFPFEGGRVKRQFGWMDKTNTMPPRGEVEIVTRESQEDRLLSCAGNKILTIHYFPE